MVGNLGLNFPPHPWNQQMALCLLQHVVSRSLNLTAAVGNSFLKKRGGGQWVSHGSIWGERAPASHPRSFLMQNHTEARLTSLKTVTFSFNLSVSPIQDGNSSWSGPWFLLPCWAPTYDASHQQRYSSTIFGSEGFIHKSVCERETNAYGVYFSW